MGISLPRASYSDAPQKKKRQVPLEQIIAVQGNNPYAQAIDQITPVLSQALQRRAELRQKAQQIAAISKITGQDVSGVTDPSLAATLGLHAMESQKKDQEKLKQISQIRSIEKLNNLPEGSLGDDLQTARLQMLENRSLRADADRDKGRDAVEGDKFKVRLNNQKNRMVNDPRVKPLHAQGIGLGQIDDIVKIAKSGNTVASTALGVKMARGMGEVGVMTDSDVVRYVTSGRLDRKAADILSRWIRGVPTDATLSEIQQITGVLKDNFSVKMQPVFNEYIDSFAETEGLTPDDVSKKMAIPYKPTSGLQPLPVPGKATHRWNPQTGKVEPL